MSMIHKFVPIQKRLHWTWLPVIGNFEEPAHTYGSFHVALPLPKPKRILFAKTYRRRRKRAGQLELFN